MISFVWYIVEAIRQVFTAIERFSRASQITNNYHYAPIQGGLRKGHDTQNVNKLYLSVQLIPLIVGRVRTELNSERTINQPVSLEVINV